MFQSFATRNPAAYGATVTLLGTAFFFPDALVVRLIDADIMTLAVWRGLAAFCTTFVFILLFQRQSLFRLKDLARGPALAMILLQGVGSVFFLASLDNTTAANALLILATAPFLAALLSWALLREKIDRPTAFAIFVVFIGVGIIASGSSAGGASSGGRLLGDLFALANACTIAAYYVALRAARDQNLLLPIALGYLLTSTIAFPFASMAPLSLPQGGLIFLSGGIILAGGVGLLMVGPRYLPAAEVSMITLLEIVVGPLLVWWVLGEDPGLRSLIGGGVIILAITAHSLSKLRATP